MSDHWTNARSKTRFFLVLLVLVYWAIASGVAIWSPASSLGSVTSLGSRVAFAMVIGNVVTGSTAALLALAYLFKPRKLNMLYWVIVLFLITSGAGSLARYALAPTEFRASIALILPVIQLVVAGAMLVVGPLRSDFPEAPSLVGDGPQDVDPGGTPGRADRGQDAGESGKNDIEGEPGTGDHKIG